MSLYRPTYTDKKTGETKQSKVWWYEFVWNGERIRDSTKVKNKRAAEQIECAHKTNLARGQVGIIDRVATPTLKEFSERFGRYVETEYASKPATIRFYKEKLRRL